MKLSRSTILTLTACFLFSAFPKAASAEETYYTDYSSDETVYYDESYDQGYTDYSGESYSYDSDGTVDYSSGSETFTPSYEETYTDSGAADTSETAESEDSETAETGEETEETVEVEPFDPANIVPGEIVTNSIPGWPQGPAINCASAILIEESTGTVLYSSDSDHMYYPSGTVKIMTCLLALENSSLDEEVTFTETGVSGATDGATNIAAQVDETFTMEQCLYAIMLNSSNESAYAVAEHVGGSVERDRARGYLGYRYYVREFLWSHVYERLHAVIDEPYYGEAAAVSQKAYFRECEEEFPVDHFGSPPSSSFLSEALASALLCGIWPVASALFNL